MKRNSYKTCNRKKCPYYNYKICPNKEKCIHSKTFVWIKGH